MAERRLLFFFDCCVCRQEQLLNVLLLPWAKTDGLTVRCLLCRAALRVIPVPAMGPTAASSQRGGLYEDRRRRLALEVLYNGY